MRKLGNIIPIRFSDEEKHALKNRAQLEGSTASAVARKAIQQFLAIPIEAISYSFDRPTRARNGDKA